MGFNGLLNLSFWGWLGITFLVTHVTIVSVTLFLHRSQAHRSLDIHPLLAHFFRFWLWFTTGQITKAWVAIHRKHHAHCETPDDPHSPQVLGLPTVLWQGAELYRKEAKVQETLDHYGRGTPDDWIEHKLYTPYSGSGLILMTLIYVILMGAPGLITAAIQMAWIPFWAAGVINGIGHFWGYRNFECKDAATNIVPWGLLIGGEELHNNHHAFGTSAKFSVKWWEFDLGWFYIQLFSLLGLMKVRRVYPKLAQVKTKTHIDLDTVKALLINRLTVLSHYTQDVLLPVFKDAQKSLNPTARRLRTLLVRDRSLVADADQQRIQDLLQQCPTLKEVYLFRDRLQSIWEKTTASHKELIEALQAWCHAAEQTGIEALQRFAAGIRHYALLPNTESPLA